MDGMNEFEPENSVCDECELPLEKCKCEILDTEYSLMPVRFEIRE